jgi:hypothetical protein
MRKREQDGYERHSLRRHGADWRESKLRREIDTDIWSPFRAFSGLPAGKQASQARVSDCITQPRSRCRRAGGPSSSLRNARAAWSLSMLMPLFSQIQKGENVLIANLVPAI